ncbi:MAG TPA: SpoIIE family protein phosphatase [Bryobacteraceae bacterium]|nr:SpoIIE family protein phosphatase [Bryobacteraceae bacterium]
MTAPRPHTWARHLGRIEKAFLAGLILYLVLRLAAPESVLALVLALAVYILGVAVAARLARKGISKAIWRLRNRVIVAYLFIAVVPIVLLIALGFITTYIITGQVAGYLVTAELNRRTEALRKPAEELARIPAAHRPAMLAAMLPFYKGAFPQIEAYIRDSRELRVPPESRLGAAPEGWGNTHGIVLRDGRQCYSWARAVSPGTEVILAAPISRDFLAGLVPGLGTVAVVLPDVPARKAASRLPEEQRSKRRNDRVPPPYNRADITVTGFYPIPLQIWERPSAAESATLTIQTRTSAVLGLVFGHNAFGNLMEMGQLGWWVFIAISLLFLLVELISLVIGISITRTVTSAVHELYEGTQRVMQGDFSHRIAVTGNDQLAALGVSFNTMTANLERLIVVAKEKERLQSELEIAREVQGQLFPKNVPDLRTLQMTGVCHPARMVSGDYYDFMHLQDSTLAFAIGDVAGKGISAALLMAAIQSTMRTQLTAGMPAAAAAGNGGVRAQHSTARLVAQLNRQLYSTTSPEKYATFYFGMYDDETNTLTYTNAGHLPPILVRAGESQLLEVTGTVVGAFQFAEYEEQKIQLESGDMLVAYTDGIVEPENEYGEMFGEQRLTDLLVKNASCEADEIIARVMEAVAEWTGAGELQDDMTMLVARRI